jgi:hypothetical protein
MVHMKDRGVFSSPCVQHSNRATTAPRRLPPPLRAYRRPPQRHQPAAGCFSTSQTRCPVNLLLNLKVFTFAKSLIAAPSDAFEVQSHSLANSIHGHDNLEKGLLLLLLGAAAKKKTSLLACIFAATSTSFSLETPLPQRARCCVL